jgi:hypothetical protein
MKSNSSLHTNYGQVARLLAAVERSVLAFQAGMVSVAGKGAAEDTNAAIILAARLSTVWKRVGAFLPAHRV